MKKETAKDTHDLEKVDGDSIDQTLRTEWYADDSTKSDIEDQRLPSSSASAQLRANETLYVAELPSPLRRNTAIQPRLSFPGAFHISSNLGTQNGADPSRVYDTWLARQDPTAPNSIILVPRASLVGDDVTISTIGEERAEYIFEASLIRGNVAPGDAVLMSRRKVKAMCITILVLGIALIAAVLVAEHLVQAEHNEHINLLKESGDTTLSPTGAPTLKIKLNSALTNSTPQPPSVILTTSTPTSSDLGIVFDHSESPSMLPATETASPAPTLAPSLQLTETPSQSPSLSNRISSSIPVSISGFTISPTIVGSSAVPTEVPSSQIAATTSLPTTAQQLSDFQDGSVSAFSETSKPTLSPSTVVPTSNPTFASTTLRPTQNPTVKPTIAPTPQSTDKPTSLKPATTPTLPPTGRPTTISPTEPPVSSQLQASSENASASASFHLGDDDSIADTTVEDSGLTDDGGGVLRENQGEVGDNDDDAEEEEDHDDDDDDEEEEEEEEDHNDDDEDGSDD